MRSANKNKKLEDLNPDAITTPPLVDTHAHICDGVFDPDREVVLGRAAKAGVTRIIAVGEDISDARSNIELAGDFPILLPVAGLYPAHADAAAAEEMITFIRKHQKRLVAIGEVGLDRWIAKEEKQRKIQEEVLAAFVDLSLELDLPLNVHSRSAGRRTVELLLQRGARRVQMHAFDGKISAALPGVEAGYYFSMPPSLVRSRQKQKLLRHIPMECLLAETDSPVLGAQPGERNEPANLITAIEAIAEIKGEALDAVIAHVGRNASKLYSIGQEVR